MSAFLSAGDAPPRSAGLVQRVDGAERHAPAIAEVLDDFGDVIGKCVIPGALDVVTAAGGPARVATDRHEPGRGVGERFNDVCAARDGSVDPPALIRVCRPVIDAGCIDVAAHKAARPHAGLRGLTAANVVARDVESQAIRAVDQIRQGVAVGILIGIVNAGSRTNTANTRSFPIIIRPSFQAHCLPESDAGRRGTRCHGAHEQTPRRPRRHSPPRQDPIATGQNRAALFDDVRAFPIPVALRGTGAAAR